MEESVFQACLEKWSKSDGYTKFWPELAEKYGYPSGEVLRDKVKKERKKRGITKDNLAARKTNNGNGTICIFDIELAPMLLYGFELYDQNFGVEQIVSDTFIISWAAKMLNEPKMFSDVLTQEEILAKDDYRITKSLWDFLSPCNLVIGQNVLHFDLKKLNVRLLVHKLPPLPKFQVVDTLQVAKQNFSFPSNSLKFLSHFLHGKEKIETEGFKLWRECMEGSQEALKKMDEYCQGDVLSTEDIYFQLRPFIRGHPNLALYFDDCNDRCPNCGSTSLSNEGFYYTPAGKWASLRCKNCGALSRTKTNELDKEKRKSLKVN